MTDSPIRCTRCDLDRRPDEWYRHPDGKIRKPCKPCRKRQHKENYASGGVDRVYDQLLRREYGTTIEQYDARLRKQASRCAICRRAETMTYKSGRVKRLAVDHDHVTGAVRGLLCHRCNILVWAIEDNHTTLDAIRRYVEEWRESFANGAPIEE